MLVRGRVSSPSGAAVEPNFNFPASASSLRFPLKLLRLNQLDPDIIEFNFLTSSTFFDLCSRSVVREGIPC